MSAVTVTLTQAAVNVTLSGNTFTVEVVSANAAVTSVHGRTGAVVGAEGDYTAAQITETDDAKILTADERAAITANSAKRTYPAADEAKLVTIEENAKDDQTGAEIKALYEAEANTNAFTDAEKAAVAANSAKRTYPAADENKLAGIAVNANNYSHPNHTGDVTSAGDGAQTIANNAVTNAKLAQMSQATIKGRASGAGTGDPADLTKAQIIAILAGLNIGDLLQLVDVDGNPGLPAIDGSLLTGISAGGGGLVNTLLKFSAETFTPPSSSWTNYSNVGEMDYTTAVPMYKLDSDREEPMQAPEAFTIPTGCTSLKFRIAYKPLATADSSKVAWLARFVAWADGEAVTAEADIDLDFDTLESSGQNIHVYEKSVTIASPSLSAGDTVLIVLMRDGDNATDDTFASDVGFMACEVEAVA